MKRVDELSLSLLRAVLFPDVAHVREDESLLPESLTVEEWKAVAEFFSRQSLDGLLADAVAMLPVQQQPPMAVKMPMIARQLQVERMNSAMNGELLAFTEELHSRNIPYLLLKGQGVAAFYPNPQHRMCGDIDLYVPKEYLQEVHRGLMAFGATRDHENVHHVCYHARGIVWELHHSICYFQKEKRGQMFMRYVQKAMLEPPHRVGVGQGQVCVLPPTTNVVLLLAHIVDHFYCEGIGLRQLCDYARLLHYKRNEINRDELLQMLDALSLTRAYRVFGYIAIHYLGMPEEALLLQPTKKDVCLAHRVMTNCLGGGNFGHSVVKHRHTMGQKVMYYIRYFRHLWRFRRLHPSEALWWPLAKIRRALKGEVNVSEERSAVTGEAVIG